MPNIIIDVDTFDDEKLKKEISMEDVRNLVKNELANYGFEIKAYTILPIKEVGIYKFEVYLTEKWKIPFKLWAIPKRAEKHIIHNKDEHSVTKEMYDVIDKFFNGCKIGQGSDDINLTHEAQKSILGEMKNCIKKSQKLC